MNNGAVYRLMGVGKEFAGPTEPLRILTSVDLVVEPGESVAVLGASGSGKTTLLHILGTLDEATSGEIYFSGQDMKTLGPERRARLRNSEIGFVFQFHHLLPEFSTLENVAMPGVIQGRRRDECLSLAAEALDLVGLEQRKEHRVTTLSGGERQRAAIARAILLRPKVLLADEPTGNLDEKTGKRIAGLLADLNRELGMTFVVVTHNVELAGLMQRRMELHSGELYARQ
ncbi:MAG: ABC transporter ATP-binding protein [Desulfovibrionaceae bacterium]|nr:ABC transporter ATP-binding protein [Desulfovibrionaceae bacterium]